MDLSRVGRGALQALRGLREQAERDPRKTRAADPDQLRELKVDLSFAVGGIKNHEVYFEHLGGDGGDPTARSPTWSSATSARPGLAHRSEGDGDGRPRLGLDRVRLGRRPALNYLGDARAASRSGTRRRLSRSTSTNTAGAQESARDLALHARSAAERSNDPIWRVLEYLPIVGANLTAVRWSPRNSMR